MTVSSTTRKAGPFLGNGVTTIFPFTFKVFARSDLDLTYTNAAGVSTALTLDGQYSVALNADQDNNPGGSITYPLVGSPLAVGEQLVGIGDLPAKQGTDLTNLGRFLPQVIEDALDYAIILIQQLLEAQGRTLTTPVTDSTALIQLPAAAGRLNKFVAFDASGQPYMSLGTGNDSALRSDLAASSGSALVNFIQAGTGASAITLQAFLRGLFITPAQFGAVGNGVTDDTTAWTNCLAAAAGRPIVGDPTKTYAITGDLLLPAITRIRDCAFKQLSPANANRRTLNLVSGTYCELVNVKVDRNGTGVGGSAGSAGGIYLNSCARVLMQDCEVTGADYGIGIAIVDCDEFRLTRPYVHDIRGGNAAGAVLIDDAVQGIWIVRGLRGVIEAPRIDNLTTQWLAQAEWTRFTRGIAVSGAADLQIVVPTVDSVDQGIDISGSDNPDRVVVLGGSLNNCRTWGGKCANTVTFSRWIGVTARNCGLGGFVCSGWATGPVETNSIIFESCVSLGTGAGGFWAANTPAGFVILNGGGAFTAYPRGVRFVNCLADGIGGLMKYGFYSDTVYQANEYWNETVNCTVRNHTVGKYSATTGFMQGICTRYRAAVQSIPNNAQTAITFDTTQIDRMNGISGTTSQIVITKSGVYSISGTCAFAGNATNTRALRVLRNGTPIPGCKAGLPGNASVIAFTATAPCACDPGDLITMEVFQDSGGALNTSAGDVVLSVVLVNADRGLA